MRTAGTTNLSSPLLCIGVYFCCHPHAEFEALDEGIFLRQSDHRELTIFDLLQLLFLLIDLGYL